MYQCDTIMILKRRNKILFIKNIYMAKRKTGVGKGKKSHSHKTAKRLEVKRLMLEEKANKKKRK